MAVDLIPDMTDDFDDDGGDVYDDDDPYLRLPLLVLLYWNGQLVLHQL